MKKGKKLLARTLLVIMLLTVFPVPGALANPTIVVSTPVVNSVVTTGSVKVSGYVTDTSTLTINGAGVYPGVNGFFSYTVNGLSAGNNSITIAATSSTGSLAASVVNVVYDSQAGAPVLTFSNPSSVSSEVFTGTVNITGTSFCDNLDISINGSVYASLNAVAGAFTQPVPLALGDNTIVITARKGDLQDVKTLYVRYNNSGAGLLNIYNLLPDDNITVTTNSVTVSGTVAVPPTSSLTINNAAVPFNTLNGNFNKSITLSPGLNTVVLAAYTAGGVTSITRTINITYGNNPVIVVTSPVGQEIVYRDTVTITGKVFNTTANKFFINGEQVSFNTSDGGFSKTVSLKNVRNSIALQAYNGNLLTTKNLIVWSNVNPVVTVTSHTYGQTVNELIVILEGTIIPGQQSDINTFTIKGVDNKSRVVNGSFRSAPVELQPGDNNIIISLTTKSQTTPNGYTIPAKSFSKTLKLVSPGKPDITVSSPYDGSTVYSNIITVRGQLQYEDFSSLTIDGKAVTINSDGSFRQEVAVKSGENKIDLKATYGATTIPKTLTVYYNTIADQGAEIKTVVKDGDEVTVFNDGVKVKLAKDSLGLDTTSVLAITDPSDIHEPPKQSAFVGPLVQLDWEGDKPIKPYKITLQYDPVVRENQAHKVSVFFFDDNADEWEILGGIVDAKARTISVETDKAGYFAATLYFRSFDDVANHWAQRDIEFMVAQGVLVGGPRNTFRPNDNITRAEFITFVVKALGIQPYEPDNPSYSDVDEHDWAYTFIEAALRAGLISGVSHDRFAPNRFITREEAGALLARAGNLKTLKETEITKIFSDYNDSARISSWARNELASAIKSKILSGLGDGVFSPNKYTTRAETAAMIARLTEVVNKTKGTGK